MNGANIRAALTTLLATIDGLKVYGALPSKPELPAATIVLPSGAGAEFPLTFDVRLASLEFEVLVVVTRANGDERAAAELDLYVFEQIPDALYSDVFPPYGCLFNGATPSALTASADEIVVQSATAYAPVTWGDLDLLGCRVGCQLHARHT